MWVIGKWVRYWEITSYLWVIDFTLLRIQIISFSYCKNILHLFFQPLEFSFFKQMLRGWTHILVLFFMYSIRYNIANYIFIDHLKTFIFELLLSLQIIYVAYTIYRIESYNMEGYDFAYLMLVYPPGNTYLVITSYLWVINFTLFMHFELSLSHIAKIFYIYFSNLSNIIFWNKCWEVETCFCFIFLYVWLDWI